MKILFLASSRTQEKQYKEICEKTTINGFVLNIKHPGLGNFASAARWLLINREKYKGWVSFQLEKNRVRGIKESLFRDFYYCYNIMASLAAVISVGKRKRPDYIYLRNGSSYVQLAIIAWAREFGIKTIYTENGQLPNTFVVDGKGVNNNSSIPRNKEFYSDIRVPEGYSYTKRLVARKNKVETDLVCVPDKYFFVPFQVPTDTQVLINSPWINTMEKFYALLENSVDFLPEGCSFVVKEHPSSWIRYPEMHHRNSRIIFANGNDTQELIEKSISVITLNSSAGIEALMLGKTVITLGDACYNIQGMANHVSTERDFQAMISMPDQLAREEKLVCSFIWWLENKYLLPGQLRNFHESQDNLDLFVERLNVLDRAGAQAM